VIRDDSVSMLSRLAPTPPGVEACSCDEALALRRELGEARERLARGLPDARQLAVESAWRDGGPGHD
jgi:hypothetical protein